jgi:hypothetical protein
LDLALGRGAHRIEAEQRAGRHDDPGTGLCREIDQIGLLQELADAHRHEDPAGPDRRLGDLTEHCRRGAFDHHVGAIGELVQTEHRHGPSEPGKPRLGLRDVARADRGEPEPRQATIEAAADRAADRAEAGKRDAELSALGHQPAQAVLRVRRTASRQPAYRRCRSGALIRGSKRRSQRQEPASASSEG